MALSKRQREEIYKKYNGRCAYCGDKIEYKDMQVDHIKPKHLGGRDEMVNYMPSCRACNFYKSTFSLEEFRKRLENIPKQLEKIFIYKLAKKHFLVHQEQEHVVFWFEDVEYRRTHPEEDWA